MANRKLDMGKAWTQTTALIGANKDTISAIAGLFIFLPSFAAALFVPEIANPPQPAPQPGADPQVAMQATLDQLTAMYADNWALFLAITIAGFVGSMSLLALLTDRGNPTVGEALGKGLKSIPSYIAAQILCGLAAGLVIGLPLGLVGAFAPPAVTVLVSLLLVVLAIYLVIKFSLIAPVIAIDEVRNPFTAIARSWQLTKGNSLRIFAFLVLLFVVIVIIGALVQGVLTLILSAFGGSVASIGTGIVGALVNAVVTVIFLVVIAAVHRQLAGASPERLAETFE
ncbi:glycerophosphoryl diester phosphodiesterase membrane domain-containing protein [Erythrobacter sp. sf7]|uniref:Glycerophosphoryl diester phosphodiesterase membrane domain-containing protein n=1 Tax=Erythrobacter fulvus TaxID=2987523 RepID=A0ABT5JNQ6_9SPHN|nr:glycerophosphoryl diester phosphodiesterase membrane domain-containing protein [Erythrobacter fulvus]MDC8754418.1 glycerophosphoryl diester phosphodiesterase membrane domain-containing protein [Erythrobacter fulvus]